MKAAVSTCGDIVSAVFDFADEVTVFECHGTSIVSKQKHVLRDPFMPLRAAKIGKLGVRALICGAISNPSMIMLRHHGIEVVYGITGNADTVIRKFISDTLDSPRYRLPGFAFSRGRRGWCGKYGRNRWGCRRI